jgi:methanogenic corrinoid protein MtbC1
MYHTIADLPTEPIYTIKAVVNQTGIRAVTLRAWERRYHLLMPQRGGNQYRLYSEQEVALLRWVKSRVDSGIPIRSVALEVKNMQQTGEMPEPIPSLMPVVGRVKAKPAAFYAEALYKALIAHDEAAAHSILRETRSGLNLTTVCMEVITPCLVKIGEAWHRGEIRIATEHAASNFLRGKLLSFLQSYPIRRDAPFILIGCAPLELHEIGNLMISVMLRAQGYRVEYLGQDVPLEDLVDYARYEHPALVVLSATMESSVREISRAQEKLDALLPPVRFGYGGRAFTVKLALREQTPGVYLGDTLADAVNTIERLLGPAN